jgi:hypothetical protein
MHSPMQATLVIKAREKLPVYKPSLRATGSAEWPPDDRLREAIHLTQQSKHGLLRRKRSSQ